MERRSPSYEMRLAKYAERGFAVVVPSLERNKIDPQLFEKRFDQLQGLARLLLLEKLKSPESSKFFFFLGLFLFNLLLFQDIDTKIC